MAYTIGQPLKLSCTFAINEKKEGNKGTYV